VDQRRGAVGAATRAKNTPERAWLGEISSMVLQQALADLDAAYRKTSSPWDAGRG
jgi:hypothetical protein